MQVRVKENVGNMLQNRVGERTKIQRERACLAEDMPHIYYSFSEISTDGISPR